LLKAFQRLGYFPKLADVPPVILTPIRGCLHLHRPETEQELAPRTLNRYRSAIRAALHVAAYAKAARRLAVRAASMTLPRPWTILLI
jgi:hypothetical protein